MTGSPVLPYFAKRLENGKGYVLQIYPEVDPDTSDPQKYMQNIYTVLEEHILQHPEQYYWVHRRFKNTTSSKDPYNQSWFNCLECSVIKISHSALGNDLLGFEKFLLSDRWSRLIFFWAILLLGSIWRALSKSNKNTFWSESIKIFSIFRSWC